MGKYNLATEEELYSCLRSIILKMTPDEILSHGEVYSFFKEEFNNEILDMWDIKYPRTLEVIQRKYLDICKKERTQSEFKEVYVKLLAETIKEEGDFDIYRILGPAGLNCNYFIEFIKDKERYNFTFFEHNLDGQIGIYKERKSISPSFEYKPGTIGYLNQGNLDHVILNLGMNISEIIDNYLIKEEEK